MPKQQDTLIEFPCQFPIKAMGESHRRFPGLVLEIVKRHAPNVKKRDLTQRPSSKGKYLAITVTFEATSKSQLDAIYQDLYANKHVLMTL